MESEVTVGKTVPRPSAGSSGAFPVELSLNVTWVKGLVVSVPLGSKVYLTRTYPYISGAISRNEGIAMS